MYFNSLDYAPYYYDGLLYLPPKTVDLLREAGLAEEVTQAALNGLALDDDKALIGEISSALEVILEQVTDNSPIHQDLNTEETQFLLTGRPVQCR
jgi:hypothetical protein